jgi:hypothetical protein
MRNPMLALFLVPTAFLAACAKPDPTGPHPGHYEFERDVESDARQCPTATNEPQTHPEDPSRNGYIDGSTATLDATATVNDDNVYVITAFNLSAQDSGGYDYNETQCPLDGASFACKLDDFQIMYSISIKEPKKTWRVMADLGLSLTGEWTDDTHIELKAIETIYQCADDQEFEDDAEAACEVFEGFVAQDSILDENGDPHPVELPCTNARAYEGTWVPPVVEEE